MKTSRKLKNLWKKVTGRKRLESSARRIDRKFQILIQVDPILSSKRNHRTLVLYRLRCGKPAYRRMSGLDGMYWIGADILEFWSLKNKKPFTECPIYNQVLLTEKITNEIFGHLTEENKNAHNN